MDFNELIAQISENHNLLDYFEKDVRITIDEEREKFEDLLQRAMREFKEERISWVRLLGFFSRRGRLEGYYDLELSPGKYSENVMGKEEQENDE